MSRIVITTDTDLPARTVMQIFRITGDPITLIRNNAAMGLPIHDALLFMNDQIEVGRRLRHLIDALKQDGIGFEVHELREDEVFADAPKHQTRINEYILENILAEWDDPQG